MEKSSFSGSVNKLLKSKTLTAKYLKELKVKVPKKRVEPNKGWLKLTGASENNLKKVDAVSSVFSCVTGVSGSGKSTLVDTTLKEFYRYFYNSKDAPGSYSKIEGLELIDKMIVIDQSPIGQTPDQIQPLILAHSQKLGVAKLPSLKLSLNPEDIVLM